MNPEVLKIENNITRKVGIMTLGCKVNQYESTAIAEEFEKHGFTIGKFSEKCGIYIINTCTVTGESDRKTRQMIRRAARHNPNAYVLVTGCYSQLNPGKTAGIDGVDFICGNGNKMRLVDAALGLIASGEKNGAADIKVDDIMSAPFEAMTIHSSERTRAYVKIEDGCDNHCTYCIVPQARGKVRSKAPAEILDEVRGLIAAGYREVVLTGIETASYGKDFHDGYSLADLLEAVDGLPGIERIRLGSLDPSILRPEFVSRIAKLQHFAPNFHISVQSGCDRILREMKRKYNVEMIERYAADLREKIPGVTFNADIIVGFPTETEEEARETEEFVKRFGFTHLHLFPYSRRAGTPAAEMDGQLPDTVKAERLARLDEVQRACQLRMAESYIGEMREVLFELCEDGRAIGHTPEFLEVAVITPDDLHNETRIVKLNGFDGTMYTGFIV
ncbi:MAG: tRNA (N(6)-L-threonylcarbamoyladenosine(37)-C(2))-methylthiotransferase MtaB [Ruminococcaceae bacterium]|nr:tRNA (N(6)-L-threonylcarbamoyladenosine(37)-C(2))-methylthiotransferase MtaB [Oscillospiraceae bacterium]